MTTFLTCRNGKGPMQQRLRDAVALFYKQRKRLPDIIVVNASELAEAQAAAKSLKLTIEVQSSGGCLVPEVWLGEERGKADVD